MTWIFEPLVSGTFARLSVASEFLKVVDDAIPLLESKARSDLERFAGEEDLEAGEYFMEKDILDWRFQTWIPTFAAYSVIVLTYSIVEAQLNAFAEILGKRRGAEPPEVNEKSGIDQAALYLVRVLSVPVKKDPAWSCIKDMQKLRNAIVHRNGKCGKSSKQQEEEKRLLRRYPLLKLKKLDGVHDQIVIPMPLCRAFSSKADAFFERAFKSAGLPIPAHVTRRLSDSQSRAVDV